MSRVRFNYADVKPVYLTKKRKIKEFVNNIFVNEGKELQRLDYVFCSDNYLLEINKVFLNHHFFTDVISFDLSEGTAIIGEVYISIERVKDNANAHSAAFSQEFLRVVFHGALHLCGYKDKKKSEITVMRQKEDYYLRVLQEKN